MDRLEKYKEKEFLMQMRTLSEDNEIENKINELSAYIETKRDHSKEINERGLWESCKEVIFEYSEQKYIFHLILYMFNYEYERIEITNAIVTETDEESEAISNLAYATVYDVPVYPNNENHLDKLISLKMKLHQEGFTSSDDNKQYKLSGPYEINFSNLNEYLKKQDLFLKNIDLELLKNLIKNEIDEINLAKVIILSLKYAILGLENLLNATKRNENAIQKHLTEYPILFGLDYRKIHPKFKLGSEFETDYVIEKIDGSVEIIEIESSTLNLYTKKNQPTSNLVHAEQQVLDWIDWIEKNNSYARKKIDKLYSPYGIIIIGRSDSLSVIQKESLARRNIVLRNSMRIYTYDDVLNNAKTMLTNLIQEKTI